MSKVSRKNKFKPFYKEVGFYFILIYAILTIGFIAQMFMVNILPMKYSVPIAVILGLLLLGMYFLQMGKHVSKINKILGRILIVLLSVFLGLGNFYLFKTGSAFNRMTNDNTQTTVISVIVMKDNKAKNISDLKNGTVGLMKTGDSDSLNKAVTEIKKDTDNTINVTEYKSYETIANELYDGKINAIILDEGTRGLFEDNHSKFNTETRVIKTYKY
ncbi:MAG: LCP family protein, partial [Longicatena sp.]